MLKKCLIIVCILVLSFSLLVGCDQKAAEPESDQDWAFSKEDTDQVNKDNTEVWINGKRIDETSAKELQDSINAGPRNIDGAVDDEVAGLPEGEDSTSDEDSDEDSDGESEMDYNKIQGVSLKKGYPADVVPIYKDMKIIEASAAPSGTLHVVEGATPPKSYDKVVAFYKATFNTKPNSFKSELMKRERFEGKIGKWTYMVEVAELLKSGQTFVQINLNSK